MSDQNYEELQKFEQLWKSIENSKQYDEIFGLSKLGDMIKGSIDDVSSKVIAAARAVANTVEASGGKLSPIDILKNEDFGELNNDEKTAVLRKLIKQLSNDEKTAVLRRLGINKIFWR